jgi:hypothetical protein
LENLDWVFTSTSWSLRFPNTKVLPLDRPISDHIPYLIQIGTQIPKSSVFRFENYWLNFDGFMDVLHLYWNCSPYFGNAARTLSSKFKQLRRGLKAWSRELSNLNTLIHNCSWVIGLMDGLEDARALSRLEKNFRKIVKIHQAKLLEAKRIYWKQRATFRFVKFGDENTKVFQAMATHSHRKNFIGELWLENGDCLVNHAEKAEALWVSYKNRLGQSTFSFMHYDLDRLIQRSALPLLDEPFSDTEIQAALQEMPSGHAPRPDGFNSQFMKKCWRIIKDEFLRLLQQFYMGNVNLDFINGSFITLIPKKENP